jgi:hypothetical protein
MPPVRGGSLLIWYFPAFLKGSRGVRAVPILNEVKELGWGLI